MIGDPSEVELPGIGGNAGGGPFEFIQFRKKAAAFLRDHLGEAPVAKVRSGEPLTPADIADLQRLLVAAGVGDTDDFQTASERAGNFGLFIRSLVGLDRAAAKEAFNEFLDDKRYSRNQIQFVSMVIDYLTEHGALEASRIYESPFTDVAPQGPENIFTPGDLDRLFGTVERMTKSAGALE